MAVKQERNGTKRMQSRNTLDADSINFINHSRDPDVIKWYEKQARTSALILHRWLRPKLAKKFSVEEHAKIFFTTTASRKPAARLGSRDNAERSGPDSESSTQNQLKNCKLFSIPGVVSQTQGGRYFLLDTGCSCNLVSRKQLSKEELAAIRKTQPQPFQTANGTVTADEVVEIYVPGLQEVITCYVCSWRYAKCDRSRRALR